MAISSIAAMTPRTIGAIAAGSSSLALSCLLLSDALHLRRFTDAEFIAKSRSESYMDILGFGFWPTWTAASLLQGVLLIVVWVRMRQTNRLRLIAPLLLAVFIAVSVLNHKEVVRIETLLGTTSAPS